MDAPLYEEKQVFRLRNVLLILFLLVAAAAVYASSHTPAEIIAVLCALLFAAFVLWGFSTMRTVVTATELRFGFPFGRRRFALQEIEVGDIVPLSFWYGIGIHYVRGMWVWNARLGRGVLITARKQRHLIGSDQPEKLQAVLRERVAQARRS